MKAVNKYKLSFKVSLIFAVACFALVLGTPGELEAGDFISKARDALSKLAQQGDLLSSCIQYQGMTPKGGCTEADSSGKGLFCPTTQKATGGAKETCSASIMSQLNVALGAGGKGKLSGSNLSTAQMHADIQPIDSVSHTHSTCNTPAGECAPEFIKRKDFVKFKLAVWNSSKVSVGITHSDFDASVESSEGFVVNLEALICGWKDHADPRMCNPECQPPVVIDPDETEPPHEGGVVVDK